MLWDEHNIFAEVNYDTPVHEADSSIVLGIEVGLSLHDAQIFVVHFQRDFVQSPLRIPTFGHQMDRKLYIIFWATVVAFGDVKTHSFVPDNDACLNVLPNC